MNLSFNFLGTSESGELSAYKDRFTGFYTPRGMFGSPDAYYYGADHEAYETLASYKTQLSFDFNSTTIHQPDYQVNFSGGFFGGQSGIIGTSIPSITGAVSSGMYDLPTYYTRITGEFRGNLDTSVFTNLINGLQDSSNADDAGTFAPRITGELPSALNDLSTIINVISGNLYRFEKDNTTIGVLISGVSFARGHVKERNPMTGEFTLGVTIAGIWYSRAGG